MVSAVSVCQRPFDRMPESWTSWRWYSSSDVDLMAMSRKGEFPVRGGAAAYGDVGGDGLGGSGELGLQCGVAAARERLRGAAGVEREGVRALPDEEAAEGLHGGRVTRAAVSSGTGLLCHGAESRMEGPRMG